MQAGSGAERRTMIVPTEERDKGGSERACVDVLNEDACAIVLDDIRQPTGVERDNRRFAELRFDGDEPETFANRRNDERGGLLVKGSKTRLRQGTVPTNAIGNPQSLGESREGFTIFTVADDVEAQRFVGDARERVKQ